MSSIKMNTILVYYLHELASTSYLTRLTFFIAASITILLVFSGLLHRIVIITGPSPYRKLVFAYKFIKGNSQKAHNYLNYFQNLTPNLPRITINYNGLHYNKKQHNREETFAVGVVVSVNNEPAMLENIKLLQEYDFGFSELPGIDHAILASFPHRNYLSVCLAAMRVLPKIRKFVKKGNLCAHPIVELIRDGQIDYVVPLAWQFDYYVPQAKKYYRMMDMHEPVVIRATPEPTLPVISKSSNES